MQGVGCITAIFMAVLWVMLAAFLGFGMPIVGMLASLLIWRQSRVFGSFLGVVSTIALFVSVPIYTGWIDAGADDLGYSFLAIMQALITAMLLGYAWLSPERQTLPRSGGYDFALVGGWIGLAANVYVFGLSAFVEMTGG